MKVRCIEQLQTKQVTFRPGEEYTGNEINERWWIVDSVGVETEEFHLHFEAEEEPVKVITEEEASAEIEEKKEEPEVVETRKEKWFEKLRNYIFV